MSGRGPRDLVDRALVDRLRLFDLPTPGGVQAEHPSQRMTGRWPSRSSGRTWPRIQTSGHGSGGRLPPQVGSGAGSSPRCWQPTSRPAGHGWRAGWNSPATAHRLNGQTPSPPDHSQRSSPSAGGAASGAPGMSARTPASRGSPPPCADAAVGHEANRAGAPVRRCSPCHAFLSTGRRAESGSRARTSGLQNDRKTDPPAAQVAPSATCLFDELAMDSEGWQAASARARGRPRSVDPGDDPPADAGAVLVPERAVLGGAAAVVVDLAGHEQADVVEGVEPRHGVAGRI